ncbi:MAG: hypothetical protein K0B15_08745 [Lentimicrobium sp.]|nr:hypothetical protein [Lentimicrobium sp.]
MLCFAQILTSDYTYAQQTPAKKDSTLLYGNIEDYAERSRFTRFMYRLFFKPVADDVNKKPHIVPVQKPYDTFEGKIIRQIHIETLDPFGNSIADTIKSYPSFTSRAGNKLHIKTQPATIRNLLLFRKNQAFDSLLVKESERLVRSRGYVTDVAFFIKATSENSDSVDIFIRELDTWSIIPEFDVTNTRVGIKITEKNFAGLGHEFRNGLTRHLSTGGHDFKTSYSVPNIMNSFISSKLYYGTDEFGNFRKSFDIDRPFFSPYAKWAAGVNISQQAQKIFQRFNDTLVRVERYKFNAQDYWAGSAIQLFKGNSENSRTSNFITAIRYTRIRYPEKPEESADPEYLYHDEDFYLASIGVSRRKYFQDKYVFKFGLTEDVPVGNVYSLTGGYQKRNSTGRFYTAAQASFGNYFSFGYLSANFDFGTFIHNSKIEQGIFSAGFIYFTGLKEVGKWKFRQFVKPQLTVGLNRYATDSLTLNNNVGLPGFSSQVLSGNSRLLLTLQTQAYSPWNFIGFYFGPYFICSLGVLGDTETGFSGSRIYSQFGLGVLIKNINLIINTFQVSISYYPVIPGKGNNIIKFNSYETEDFNIRDFEIGKPTTTLFQ